MKRLREIREQSTGDLEGVLLPHQLERLRQIGMRSRLRYRSLVDVLTSDPVKTEIGLSDEQAANLRKSEQKIQEELEEQIAELRDKARKKLLSNLNRTQQEQVEQMMGPEFAFRNPDKKNVRKGKANANQRRK